MRFGLAVAIREVVLLGFLWAPQLGGVCVCLLCTNRFMRV